MILLLSNSWSWSSSSSPSCHVKLVIASNLVFWCFSSCDPNSMWVSCQSDEAKKNQIISILDHFQSRGSSAEWISCCESWWRHDEGGQNNVYANMYNKNHKIILVNCLSQWPEGPNLRAWDSLRHVVQYDKQSMIDWKIHFWLDGPRSSDLSAMIMVMKRQNIRERRWYSSDECFRSSVADWLLTQRRKRLSVMIISCLLFGWWKFVCHPSSSLFVVWIKTKR